MHTPGVLDGAVLDSFAWSEFLPAKDRRAFLDEFLRTLVASARGDLIAGRFNEARTKALQADELDLTWSTFEDQPMFILDEVDRRTDSTTYAKSSADRKPAAAAESAARSAPENRACRLIHSTPAPWTQRPIAGISFTLIPIARG